MFKVTVSYTNPNTLIQNAKSNPERTVKQLYNMYLMFPQSFSDSALPKHVAQVYAFGQFLMGTHAVAEPLSKLISSCKRINTTGYSTAQVVTVLKGYLDNFAPDDWVTFDPVSLRVSYPTTNDVILMIKGAYHRLFTKSNLGSAFFEQTIVRMCTLASKKDIYKYQAEQARQMLNILAKELPFTLDRSKYLTNAKKALATSDFKHIVAKQNYALANNGRNWTDTFTTLVNTLNNN